MLIAGCGYVGQATADLFHAAGWEVEGWTKSEQPLDRPYPIIAVDIANRAQVNARSGNFDAVIHCASTRGGDVDLYRKTYFDGARNLLDRFVGSAMLFTSSTSVYAQQNGEWVTEESAAEPQHGTGKILHETERLVLDHGGIAARLAGIYGPGRSALLRKFLSGETLSDGDRYINQVHRDDVASAFFLLLDRQFQSDRIYNVVDDNPILLTECDRWLAQKLERPLPAPARSTRLRDATARQASARKRGPSNKRVSNAKLRALGWAPQYPSFAEGMEKSVLPAWRDHD